jgi:hypothetical protein
MSTVPNDPHSRVMETELHRLALRMIEDHMSFPEAAKIIDALIGGADGCPERRKAMTTVRRELARLRGE